VRARASFPTRDTQGYGVTYPLPIHEEQEETEESIAVRGQRKLELHRQVKEKLKEYSMWSDLSANHVLYI
jgi:hypothetical protein